MIDAICMLILLFLIVPSVSALEWSTFGADYTRSGAAAISYADDVIELWSSAFGVGLRSPILVNEKVFGLSTSTEEQKTVCLDAVTGANLWTHPKGLAASNQLSSPCANDEYVYVPTAENELLCLDADGDIGSTEEIWSVPLVDIPTSPVLYDDYILLSAGNRVACYDIDPFDDGRDEGFKDNQPVIVYDTIWQQEYESSSLISPVTILDEYNGVIFAVDGQLVCLNIDTGEELWMTSVVGETPEYQSSITVLDAIFYVILDEYLYCYEVKDDATIDEVWVKQVYGDIKHPVTIGGDRVYIPSFSTSHSQGYLTCRDAATGELLWSNAKGGSAACSYAGEKIFSIDASDTLYCLNAATGETLSFYQGHHLDSQPVLTLINDRSSIIIADSSSKGTGVTCLQSNSPPSTPMIVSGPTQGIVDQTLLITAFATDPDGDSVSYKWDYGDGISSDWLSTSQTSHIYSTAGTFNVRVKAKDTYGQESEWSSPYFIEITGDSGQPVLDISHPASTTEGTTFDVTITADGQPVEGVTVTFDETSHLTNPAGQTTFTAPVVMTSTSFSIAAVKSGYQSASSSIIVTPETVEKGYLFGTVYNSNGDMLIGAQICSLKEGTTQGQTSVCTVIHDDDSFYVQTLDPGVYTVTVSKQGYQPVVQTNVEIQEQQAYEINCVLQPENVQTTTEEQQLLHTAIELAKQNNKIGGEITIASSTTIEKYREMTITVEKQDMQNILVTVDDDILPEQSTLLIITLEPDALDDITNLELMYDNEPMSMGSSEALFSFTSEEPLYGVYIFEDDDGIIVTEVVMFIPHFSEHTIQISSAIQEIIDFLGLGLYSFISICVLLIFFLPMLVSIVRRRREFDQYKGR